MKAMSYWAKAHNHFNMYLKYTTKICLLLLSCPCDTVDNCSSLVQGITRTSAVILWNY